MELKINREMIPVTEVILDDMQEQSIELDYVLPDYDPDIFRIISCEIQPVILSQTMGTDRIAYELRADIRVLYCGAGSSLVQCVYQQMTFSRSAQLPAAAEGASVYICPKISYANCRAISPRRLEVRGAVSIQLRVTGEKKQEIIRDVFGMHIQLRKVPVEYAAEKRNAVRTVSLSEEVELSSAKPPVRSIIRNDVRIDRQEQSILAGKLIVKGEACVHVLYTWQKEDGSCGIEPMNFTIPYSQIVDMDRIDESYRGSVDVQVIRCDIKPVSGKNDAPDYLMCEIDLRLNCTALKTASVQLVTDAFSTRYLCEQTEVPLLIDMVPEPVQASLMCSASIPAGDNAPKCIYDLRCQVRNINIQLIPEESRIRVSGMLCCSILAQDAEDMPVLIEKDEAFEVYTDAGMPVENALLRAEVEPADCTYHLASDGSITVKATLFLHGVLCPSARYTCLSDLSVDKENQLVWDGDFALKLYYGVEHESVWDIAKRCHTSVDAIMEENDLTEEQLTTPGMLFIPIVH